MDCDPQGQRWIRVIRRHGADDEAVHVQHAHEADRVALRVVTYAAPANLEPSLSAPLSSSWLTFQVVVGMEDGVPVFGPPVRLEFELDPDETDDGLDNDGDGVADEGRAVLVRNAGLPGEVRVVLSHWVRELLQGEEANGIDDNGNGLIDEPGLSFDVEGGSLNVRLSLERPDPDGRLITRTLATSVLFRNQ